MTYDFTVEQKPTYLHVIGTGALTEQNARRFLIDAYRASVERKCASLLLEMRFSGPPLPLASIYSVIVERSPDGTRLERIAYVDADRDSAEFAQLAAMNRGVNVRLFCSLGEAERWLQST
jgi:hypothetical protein